ncbi:hypothetical protein [Sphingomonas bacterium]|uniref:hypothetical protein n=1 Tax=Sphingomonas bacterium TaxID=1895847 RepID=UPI00157663F6|nr:hypothetical protein [Sphingomonas bacterium]
MSLIVKIDRYLRHTNMPPTTFGRRAINDPRLVKDLQRGRELRPVTVARVEAFLSGGPA